MKPQRFHEGQLVVCKPDPEEPGYRNASTGETFTDPPAGVAIIGQVYTVDEYDHWSVSEQEWFITLKELPDSQYCNSERQFEPLVSSEHLAQDLAEIAEPVENLK
jgi:hypothetical protein